MASSTACRSMGAGSGSSMTSSWMPVTRPPYGALLEAGDGHLYGTSFAGTVYRVKPV
jgi:hypothetical protein